MGKKLIIKGADFSANKIVGVSAKWFGWLGGDGITHFMSILQSDNKVALCNNGNTIKRSSLSYYRSVCVVDVSNVVGKTLSLTYSKNRSNTYYYAGFASDIDLSQLNTDFQKSKTNTSSIFYTNAVTLIPGECWNNGPSEGSFSVVENTTVEKVVPDGAKYLIFDHTQSSGTEIFNGEIEVLDA